MYLAVIGDIVDSRAVANRARLQEELKNLLGAINEEFRSELAASFVITLGDEFQGLLAVPEVLFPILHRIRFGLHPVKIRFGLGLGNMSTALEPAAIGADGPAFHLAREMVARLKEGESAKQRGSAYIRMGFAAEYCAESCLINAAFGLMGFLEDKWTDKQREAIGRYLYAQGSQRALALALGISQSNVQRRFKNAGFYDYLESAQSIGGLLTAVWQQQEGEGRR